ncbi:RNA methyltransferase [Propionivibrio sp.]|uniref:RNA methyltransferase n=1 Tax=Propionivibrio sp. TaxID=2212460 RepID=UPI003BF33B72
MNLPSASHSPALPRDSRLDRIRIVLSHTSHPGNIGAAARAMKTMGLSRLTLVNPKCFPDAEAVTRAVGADDILQRATVCQSLDAALADTVFAVAISARQRSLGPEPMQARQAAPEVLALAAGGDVALVFGNETAGLSNAEVQRCQRTVFIPANPEYTSLNLGSAVQLLCYELRLAAFDGSPPVVTKAIPFASPLATNDDIERFYAHLERIMIATEFLDPQQPKRLLPKLRRLFGRSELERDEINILRGILDAVEKKIGQ